MASKYSLGPYGVDAYGVGASISFVLFDGTISFVVTLSGALSYNPNFYGSMSVVVNFTSNGEYMGSSWVPEEGIPIGPWLPVTEPNPAFRT